MPDALLQRPSRYLMRRRTHLSREFPFLELDSLEICRWRDDFVGASLFGGEAAEGDGTLLTRYQSTASGAGSAAATIQTGTVNGVVRLGPGTANAGRSDLSLGLHFRGDQYAVCWWRFTTPSAITSWKFELGFTDVVSGTDAGAVNAKATPTFNATDAVVFVRDTDDDTNLTLVGVKNGTAATAIDLSTALATSTYYWVGIALVDDRARGYLLDANGRLLEETTWMEDAVTETVLLTPWAFCQNRSANARNLDIDVLDVYQRRTSTT